jgi:hypothetical protein
VSSAAKMPRKDPTRCADRGGPAERGPAEVSCSWKDKTSGIISISLAMGRESLGEGGAILHVPLPPWVGGSAKGVCPIVRYTREWLWQGDHGLLGCYPTFATVEL